MKKKKYSPINTAKQLKIHPPHTNAQKSAQHTTSKPSSRLPNSQKRCSTSIKAHWKDVIKIRSHYTNTICRNQLARNHFNQSSTSCQHHQKTKTTRSSPKRSQSCKKSQMSLGLTRKTNNWNQRNNLQRFLARNISTKMAIRPLISIIWAEKVNQTGNSSLWANISPIKAAKSIPCHFIKHCNP